MPVVDKFPYWTNYLEKNKHLLTNNIYSKNIDQNQGNNVQEERLSPEDIAPGENMVQNNYQDESLAIHSSENNHNHSAIDKIQNTGKTEIDAATFSKAGMYGGACAGFFGVLAIVVIRYFSNGTLPFIPTGYENISRDDFFNKIFPVIFLFQIAGGALLGWLCCRNALRRSNFLKTSLLFLLAFLLLLFLRQSTVRNAWRPAGEFTGIDRNGNSVIITGGPLGEPDFEALAVGFMGAVCFVILARLLRKSLPEIPSGKSPLLIMLFTTIAGVSTWCLVYFVFKILTDFSILKEYDFFISKTVFHFVFPHPERVFLMILVCMIYVYCIIASIQYHCKKIHLKAV